jgi:hypothetical protein
MPHDELHVPAAARVDPAAFEVLRLWAVDRHLQMSLSPELGVEPADFGELLADLFSHACGEYSLRCGRCETDVRASMFLAFARRVGAVIGPGPASGIGPRSERNGLL